MSHKRFGVAWTVSVALVFAALTWGALARANGRDFSGFYRVSDVNVAGETASLTLKLRVFNHSDADVSNAAVVLRDWIIPSRNFGTFPNVNVPAGQAVQLSGIFQIPKREFQSWQQGRQPLLIIEYANAAGNKVRRPIEVVPDRAHPGMRPEDRPEIQPEARPAVQ